MLPLRRLLFGVVGFVVALLGLASVSSAEVAHIESVGVLYTLDLDTGASAVVGSTGVEERFSTLAFDAGGRLFGIGGTTIDDAALFELDPETGGATPIGALGFGGLRLLTIDSDGRFWASDGGQLFAVDPTTGQANPGPVLEENIHALAARGARLFAVRDLGENNTRVDEVDATSGQLIPVLEGLPVEFPTSNATFDASGRLRLKTTLGGSLFGTEHAFVRIDLATGDTETTYETFTGFTDPLAGMVSLAIRGNAPPIDIPTLDRVAIWILVLGLLGAGAWLLNRRRP